MIEELSLKTSDSTRDIAVMTRLNGESVNMLDILVKVGIFKSRSEAVAAIIEKTLLTHKDKFAQLEVEIAKLEEIQEKAKEIAFDVIK